MAKGVSRQLSWHRRIAMVATIVAAMAIEFMYLELAEARTNSISNNYGNVSIEDSTEVHLKKVQTLPPVKKLNVSMYVGRWYQVFASATVQWTMEFGGNCVTADYAVSQTRSDVLTVQNAVSVLGAPVKVTGYGIVNPDQPGELDVSLGPPGHGPDPRTAGSFKHANYLVFGLGPITKDIHGYIYDYALVSDPSASTLYVLARNVTRFHSLYEEDVLSKLKEMNFTSFLKRPRRSNQKGCKYVPRPHT